MGLFARMFNSWALKRQRKEMQQFIDGMAAMDGQEIGYLVANATDLRNRLEKAGFQSLLDPIVFYSANPTCTIQIAGMIQDFQKAGDLQAAAALMVWAHTLRAAARPELRMQGRVLWGQLSRGFPHAEQAARDMMTFSLKSMDMAGFDQYPIGFTPDPLQ